MLVREVKCWPWVNLARIAALALVASAFVAGSASGTLDWWIGLVVGLAATGAILVVPIAFVLRADGELVARYILRSVKIPAGDVIRVSRRSFALFDANPIGPRYRIEAQRSQLDVPTSSIQSRALVEGIVQWNPRARVDDRVWDDDDRAWDE